MIKNIMNDYQKIDFSQEKFPIWIIFRMSHFWDESFKSVMNHFSRRESCSEYWETYQVHREIQFYTVINPFKGELGINLIYKQGSTDRVTKF